MELVLGRLDCDCTRATGQPRSANLVVLGRHRRSDIDERAADSWHPGPRHAPGAGAEPGVLLVAQRFLVWSAAIYAGAMLRAKALAAGRVDALRASGRSNDRRSRS